MLTSLLSLDGSFLVLGDASRNRLRKDAGSALALSSARYKL